MNTLLNKKFLGAAVIVFALFLAIGSIAGSGNLNISRLFGEKSEVASAAEIRERCANPAKYGDRSINKETCYSREFARIAEEKGPEFAFARLRELQRLDPDAIGCHLIAHGIGYGTYAYDPKNWQGYIRAIDQSCNYGAIHGIIEKHIGNLPEKQLTPEFLPTICGETPRADCNHIVGHLTLVQTEGDVNKALELCGALKVEQQLDFCYTGVFMEYQTALNLIEHGYVPESWLNWPARVSELEAVCRSYQDKEAVACWEEIVHVALTKFKNDPQAIFDFCSTAHILDGARRCRRHSIGIMAAAKKFDLQNLKAMCALSQKDDPNFEADCYVQLAASTISTIPQADEKVRQFCTELPKKFQVACLAQVKGTLSEGVRIQD